MKKFSFKSKHNDSPNPNFKPSASVKQDEKTWDEYIAHLNALLNKKDEYISKLVKQRYWKDKIIRQLEAENEKLKFEVRQARASRDLYADIPIMSAEEILNVIRSKE